MALVVGVSRVFWGDFTVVGVGLENLMKLGIKRIVVAPYFFYHRRLIKRIQGYGNKVAANTNPTIEIHSNAFTERLIQEYRRFSAIE